MPEDHEPKDCCWEHFKGKNESGNWTIMGFFCPNCRRRLQSVVDAFYIYPLFKSGMILTKERFMSYFVSNNFLLESVRKVE